MKSEIRGVWIASVENIDFPSRPGLSAQKMRADLRKIVRTAKETGLNMIAFQVRPTCDALYRSSLFPVSSYLAGEQTDTLPYGFDPLDYLLRIAHREGIAVHAWVNPLRVTMGKQNDPKTDPASLHPMNPARLHPEWTVPYPDGKLYFNCGLPEVRELIAAGVREIAAHYPVDGIVFDDYFYPYPGPGGKFDDDAAYAAYGNGLSLDDWRRENVNRMVAACYRAVKESRPSALFGIAPFGIWRNDDGKNGGSATNGLSSADRIYCDALAWMKEGTVDYMAPQIYWSFAFQIARFDILADWWEKECEKYPSVTYLICHPVYRAKNFDNPHEIADQIRYAEKLEKYRGAIHYGYGALSRNDRNVKDEITLLYLTNGKEID